MAKSFFETIIASGGFAGESFDLSAGPANLDVIDVLLSVGNGVLAENAPLVMYSTGALGATRDLDITNFEAANGRMFYISVRNSDIVANNLTITASTDINGGGATLTVDTVRDFIFFHETGGNWRAAHVKLSQASDAQLFRATFAGALWDAGTVNEITLVQSGVAGAGEIGPHGLDVASSYLIQVFRDSDDEVVDVGLVVDPGTGDITLTKTGLGPAFAGRLVVLGTSA